MRSTKLPSWIERLVGLQPLKVPPVVFAVDEDSMACVRVRRDEALSVPTVQRRSLAPGTFHQGPLGGPARDPEVLQRLVAELVELAGEVPAATLVLPDRWMRLGFLEITELPDAADARMAALRFKLKQQVPFRVEDLRVGAQEVAALPGQDEPRRLAIVFAAEVLLAQLETAFAAAGVHVGLITNQSLALASALPAAGAQALLTDRGSSYSLLIEHDRQPTLYRFKSYNESMPSEALERLVRRELKLLRTFLDEKLSGNALEAVYVVTEASDEAWRRLIGEELLVDVVPLDGERNQALRLGLPADWQWSRDGALVGASLLEIA